MTQTFLNLSKSLGDDLVQVEPDQIKPAQIKSSVVFLGLEHNRLGAPAPVMFLGNDSDKFSNLPKSLGVTRFKSKQLKSNQIKSSIVFLGLKHNRLGARALIMFLGNDLEKFGNLSKSLGGDSVQVKPDQIKPAQIKSNQVLCFSV
jgi:hypothetical protein